MRILLPLFALMPVAALAQQSPPPPRGIGVDRVTLHPGEMKAFTLQAGTHHQLLVPADAAAPQSITLAYSMEGAPHLMAMSRTGYPVSFTILADPGGNGGFQPVGGTTPLPGDGTPVTKMLPGRPAAINVGDFIGGPAGNRGA